MNIVLIGFMGTGKSAVGQRVAAQLGRPFIDLDRRIEERIGRSIAEIFEQEGEAYFRQLEREAVQEAVFQPSQPGAVIATGGGAVLDDGNVRDLKARGVLICLTASPDVIWRRVKDHRHRPLLHGGDPRAEMMRLLEARAPRYALADETIDVSSLSVDDVVRRVIDVTKRYL